MSKYKITKKTKRKEKKFSFLPLIVVILIAAAMFLLGYFTAKKNAHTHDGENVTVELPETSKEHIHEEVPEMPAAESDILTEEAGIFPSPDAEVVNTVQMGDDVWYTLYTDGTLLVTGGGSTWDFEAPMSSKDFIAESLGVTRGDVSYDWFYVVKTIVIENGVTAFGNNSLAMYKYAERVIHAGSLDAVGNGAFSYCGSRSDNEITWDISFTETEVAEDAFKKCKNYPEGHEPKTSEEDLSDAEPDF